MWEDLASKSGESKIALLQNHLLVIQILINEILEQEVLPKAGDQYSRKKEAYDYTRCDTHKWSVKVGNHKLKIQVRCLPDRSMGQL